MWTPSRRRSARRRRACALGAAAALAVGLLAACGDGRDAAGVAADSTGAVVTVAPTPAAEFLLATADSTYWVRAGDDGVAVRPSPILLARLGERLHELYVTDDDRSFRDAVFVGQRLWRRDLVSNDSAVVLADSLVADLARAWALGHPDDTPLAPDDPASEEPLASASVELSVLDVVGPYASIEWFADLHPEAAAPAHVRRRLVVDLRAGRVATLDELVGAAAARAARAEAARRFAAALDSLEVTAAAAPYVLEPESFALGVDAGRLAVGFVAPARLDADTEDGGLGLDPIPVPAPAWWTPAAAERGRATAAERVWPARPGYELVERAVDADGGVALALRRLADSAHAGVGRGDGARRAPRARTAREWPLASLPLPVQRVLPLEPATGAAVLREALRRAFDEADQHAEPFPLTAPAPGRVAAGAAPARRPAAASGV